MYYGGQISTVKKIVWLPTIALIFASVMFPACQSVDTVTVTSTTTATTTAVVTRCVSHDFYIIYEIDWSHRSHIFQTLLDTKNNIIGTSKWPSGVEYYSSDFYISCEDLQVIHDAIVQYDIKSLSGLGSLLTSGYMIPDSSDHRIIFLLASTPPKM